MSARYFCDRCGAEMDGIHPRACSEWDSEGGNWYSLCKPCLKKLKRWFKGEDFKDDPS